MFAVAVLMALCVSSLAAPPEYLSDPEFTCLREGNMDWTCLLKILLTIRQNKNITPDNVGALIDLMVPNIPDLVESTKLPNVEEFKVRSFLEGFVDDSFRGDTSADDSFRGDTSADDSPTVNEFVNKRN